MTGFHMDRHASPPTLAAGATQSQRASVRAVLLGRCPRCGEGRLFRGPFTLALAPKCERCGLDYAFADPGDGPAVFAILILGALVLGAALVAEFKFGMPLWGHIVLWGLLTPALALALLRLLKAGLIALQLRHAAAEARFDKSA